MAFVSIESKIGIVFAGVALALVWPVVQDIQSSDRSHELALAIAGAVAALGTYFGTVAVYEGLWSIHALWRFCAWAIFGGVFLALVVFGAVSSRNPLWQSGLALVAILQVAAVVAPVLYWYRERRR